MENPKVKPSKYTLYKALKKQVKLMLKLRKAHEHLTEEDLDWVEKKLGKYLETLEQ